MPLALQTLHYTINQSIYIKTKFPLPLSTLRPISTVFHRPSSPNHLPNQEPQQQPRRSDISHTHHKSRAEQRTHIHTSPSNPPPQDIRPRRIMLHVFPQGHIHASKKSAAFIRIKLKQPINLSSPPSPPTQPILV